MDGLSRKPDGCAKGMARDGLAAVSGCFFSKFLPTLMACVLMMGLCPRVAFAEQSEPAECSATGSSSEGGDAAVFPLRLQEEDGTHAIQGAMPAEGVVTEPLDTVIAPDFQVKDIEGGSQAFCEGWKEECRVIVLGRSGCENTEAMANTLDKLLSQQKFSNVQGFVFCAEADDQDGFVGKYRNNDLQNLVFAADGNAYRELFQDVYERAGFDSQSASDLPYLICIDQDNVVRFVSAGLLSEQEISSCLDRLVEADSAQTSEGDSEAVISVEPPDEEEEPAEADRSATEGAASSPESEKPTVEEGAQVSDRSSTASIYAPDDESVVAAPEESDVALAEEKATEQRSDGFKFTVANGEATITGYEGTDSNLVIPSSISGYPVTKIGDDSFAGNGVITSVRVSGTVKLIGNYAFSKCSKLKSAVLEEGCKETYFKVFEGCKSLASVYLPSTFTRFSGCIFDGCESLTNIEVSSNHPYYYTQDGDMYSRSGSLYFYAGGKPEKEVTVQPGIDDVWMGFRNAYHAETVKFANDVVSVDPSAVRGPSIRTVCIGPGVTDIDFFFSGPSLTRFEVDSRNPSFCDKDGVLLTKDSSKLVTYPRGRTDFTWSMPSSIITIGTDAFYSLGNPVEIIVNSKIDSIEDVAFNGVSGTYLVFEKGLNVQGVSDKAFYNCSMTLVGDESVRKIAEASGQAYMTLSQYAREGTLAAATISLDDFEFDYFGKLSYTGRPVTPDFSVEIGDRRLHQGKDYSITFSNNVDAGTATAKFTGIGDYSGTQVKHFEIEPKYVYFEHLDSVFETTWVYTGKPIRPSLSLIYDDVKLVKDKDYVVSYENNVGVGDAQANITFKGNYTGNRTLEFQIVTPPDPELSRLSGATALDTMAAITKQGFKSGSCDTVVIATMGGYWDALTASALAGVKNCPILLTDGSSLSSQTASEVKRLGASKVYIAGGKAAISAGVESALKKIAGVKSVERLAGDIAVNTALKIYEKGKGSWGKTAVIATSETFQDALSVSPYAYAKKAPIFLANASTHKLDSQVLAAVKAGGFDRVVIVGGTAALSSQLESQQLKGIACKRLAGPTAYETSSAIAKWCLTQGMKADNLGIATGSSYYDALAGAALCGKNNAAMVLVSDGYLSAIDDFVDPNKASISRAFVFGGPAAVSAGTYNAVTAALKR